jgi:ATP-dependent Lon protease
VTTANNLEGIPRPLQDRMEIIRIPGYTELEKLNIARKYLVPKVRGANGLKEDDLEFTDDGIRSLIRHYTKEAGVRSLERELSGLCRKVVVKVVKEQQETPVRIDTDCLHGYLGPEKFRYGQADPEPKLGVTTGLAWTEMGGELLETEVAVVPGKGKLTITGRLGEVMQESAQAAMSYVRSRADDLGLSREFYQQVDVHIHVPEGATPKDGPSAGITLATSLVSALTRIPVRSDIAMTGEVTLRGNVLPIGGLKEKVLAAHRGGIKHILLPKENERDIEDIPESIREDLKLEPVEHMDDVLRRALVLDDPEEFLKPTGTVPNPFPPADGPDGDSPGGLVTH